MAVMEAEKGRLGMLEIPTGKIVHRSSNTNLLSFFLKKKQKGLAVPAGGV